MFCPEGLFDSLIGIGGTGVLVFVAENKNRAIAPVDIYFLDRPYEPVWRVLV
jgi:hypothetical protein